MVTPSCILPRTGSGLFTITITTTSMIHGNHKFILEIIPIDHPNIKPIRSDAMFVITNELVIEQPPPALWYKDQGGRDNYIEIRVRLVDHRHCSVTSRRVPLRVTLFYENGVLVPKQDILKVDGELMIYERKGEAIIRFRIEEVSRSHQRQKFIVRISPDIHVNPRNNDINPVDTSPIEVMSKPKGGQSGLLERMAAKEMNQLQQQLQQQQQSDSLSTLPSTTFDKSTLLSSTTSLLSAAAAASASSLKKRNRNDAEIKLENEDLDLRFYPVNKSDLHLNNMNLNLNMHNNNFNNNKNKFNSSSFNSPLLSYSSADHLQSIISGHYTLIEELLKMNRTIMSEYIRYFFFLFLFECLN